MRLLRVHYLLIGWLLLPFLALFAIALRRKPHEGRLPRLVWGPDPLQNIKYWSNALRRFGYSSTTLVYEVYPMSQRSDFDVHVADVPSWLPAKIRTSRAWQRQWGRYACFCYAVRNADIVHLPFCWGFLRGTPIEVFEMPLYKLAGIKVAVIGFGGDLLQYSTLVDTSVRHVLLANYPDLAKNERKIRRQVEFATRNADFIFAGVTTDGIPRWDSSVFNLLAIDTTLWGMRSRFGQADGSNGAVRIIHTPNHRLTKGTEFLLKAIDDLKSEGLQIELDLLEGVPNEVVRQRMYDADILAEQFVICGYGLSGVEGMATGIAHMCNLEEAHYTKLFFRYSYLSECPSFSASIETLRDRLRTLITNPALRGNIGRRARDYVMKYHSEEAAGQIFGSIYRRIWFGDNVDLMTMFHPLRKYIGRGARR